MPYREYSSYGAGLLVDLDGAPEAASDIEAGDQLSVGYTNWLARMKPDGTWVGDAGRWRAMGLAVIGIRDEETRTGPLTGRSARADLIAEKIAAYIRRHNQDHPDDFIEAYIDRATSDNANPGAHWTGGDFEYTFIRWNIDAHPSVWDMIALAVTDTEAPADPEKAAGVIQRWRLGLPRAIEGYRAWARPPVAQDWPPTELTDPVVEPGPDFIEIKPTA